MSRASRKNPTSKQLVEKPLAGGSSKPARTRRAPAGKLAFAEALAGLRSLLEPYRERLEVTADTPSSLMLHSRKPFQGKALLFAGTTHQRSYVSFYLMPIYIFPELAHGISPALAARRQGKSCFNFTARDDVLFAELGKLTERGFAHLEKKGLI